MKKATSDDPKARPERILPRARYERARLIRLGSVELLTQGPSIAKNKKNSDGGNPFQHT
jgi:hypothetical protein